MPNPSSIDQRRLRDGAHALAISAQVGKTADEIRKQLDVVSDGITAMQSLDDLGPADNEKAHRDERLLWERYDALKKRLRELEGP